MNQFLGKFRPPKAPGRRSGSVRPQLETLECRAQPGSVWSAAALDLTAGIDITTPQVDQELVIQHRPAPESSLPMQVRLAEPETSAPRETAPLEAVAHTAAPTFTNDSNGLTIADQARAVGVLPAAPAAPVRPAYALSQAPTTAPTQAPSAAHPLIQGRNGTTYSVTATAAGFQAATAAVLSQDLRLQALARPKFLALDNQHVPPPGGFTYNLIYSSYLGTPDGDSHVNGFRANPSGDGSAFATGFLTDPNTGAQDAYVARISPDGASDQPMLIVGDASGANNWQGAAVDVGSDGAIYVAGTVSAVDHSQSQMFLMRVEGDVQTVDWTISPTLGGTLDQGNGARIGFDPNLGECLYATGAFQNPSHLNTALAVVRVSNLGPDPTQLQVEGHGFQFRDPQHARANTLGNSIGVDANGNMLIAASLGLHDGSDRTALLVGVPADFSAARGEEIPFNANGPTNGSYNSVDVDANGEIYLTGQLIAQVGFQPGLLLAAFTFDGRNFTLIYGSNWQLGNGTETVNWVGTGNKAIPGSGGAQAINSTANDPANPGGSNILFRVGPNGDMNLDANLIFAIGGSNDDESTALDIQADSSGAGGNDYYLAGYTNSPDFSTTANAFQPNDPGPSFYEGWIAKLQISPY